MSNYSARKILILHVNSTEKGILRAKSKEVELLNREITEKINLEKEKLQLEREKEQKKEEWRQLVALGKVAKYIVESDLDF